jgi:hypothetical protein
MEKLNGAAWAAAHEPIARVLELADRVDALVCSAAIYDHAGPSVHLMPMPGAKCWDLLRAVGGDWRVTHTGSPMHLESMIHGVAVRVIADDEVSARYRGYVESSVRWGGEQ